MVNIDENEDTMQPPKDEPTGHIFDRMARLQQRMTSALDDAKPNWTSLHGPH